jgi:hypothetical protein
MRHCNGQIFMRDDHRAWHSQLIPRCHCERFSDRRKISAAIGEKEIDAQRTKLPKRGHG